MGAVAQAFLVGGLEDESRRELTVAITTAYVSRPVGSTFTCTCLLMEPGDTTQNGPRPYLCNG